MQAGTEQAVIKMRSKQTGKQKVWEQSSSSCLRNKSFRWRKRSVRRLITASGAKLALYHTWPLLSLQVQLQFLAICHNRSKIQQRASYQLSATPTAQEVEDLGSIPDSPIYTSQHFTISTQSMHTKKRQLICVIWLSRKKPWERDLE